ncbi:glycoside hydrolase family 65 [Bacillus sp. USDA818B3_A]|uniref:glycoside hydrolase family 65 n=1 Tax=Bacillus sp. USDA818B3_A TaxID=2698834 RepID=UPI0013702118|nr:glycoside hydrolase family 65 [Bacillus sp. USDA818B3_A]
MDRKKLVGRHHPILTKIEPLAPLSVGNGEFAFTADVTGLQTFPNDYEVPLGTQSNWGWHYTGHPELYTLDDVEFQELQTHDRKVGYPLYPEGKKEAYHWLRQNPHRLQLGQISFRLKKENNQVVKADDIKNINQRLDLWEGTLYSHFTVEDYPVSVTTVCHPKLDLIGVKVVSPLIDNNRLQVVIRFPAADMTSRKWEESVAINSENNDRHQTSIFTEDNQSVTLDRRMDEDRYYVHWTWNSGRIKFTDVHEYSLTPEVETEELCFSVHFSQGSKETYSFYEIYQESKEHWSNFWSKGGVIDLSESMDERSHELERRVVLSQYLTKIHCSGSMPPQETGYMYNSWFGKFHLEMHWWHGAHFPLWGRGVLLENSLNWYLSMLPLAKELAAAQGYEGARWPKMVGFDGKQSPSAIAPVLIWQQPHVIALAELLYKENLSEATLKRWKEIVVETANFMASFAVWDEQKQAYILGPPLIPAQECHRPEESWNPPYELEYWKYGLEIAVKWAERLGEPVNPKWIEVGNGLAEPPHSEGVYLAHEGCPDTFEHFNHDHPSMVGALGILPGTLIAPVKMKKTLERVRNEWQWETAWGWDFPMCAMTAARLGEPDWAIDFLLMDATKNTYLINGHNYQSPSLTAYLPGNGGLLTAVSMMACGWEGSPKYPAPGFPKDGKWIVKFEGLHPFI